MSRFTDFSVSYQFKGNWNRWSDLCYLALTSWMLTVAASLFWCVKVNIWVLIIIIIIIVVVMFMCSSLAAAWEHLCNRFYFRDLEAWLRAELITCVMEGSPSLLCWTAVQWHKSEGAGERAEQCVEERNKLFSFKPSIYCEQKLTTNLTGSMPGHPTTSSLTLRHTETELCSHHEVSS